MLLQTSEIDRAGIWDVFPDLEVIFVTALRWKY